MGNRKDFQSRGFFYFVVPSASIHKKEVAHHDKRYSEVVQ